MIILLILWVLFFVSHSFLAANSAKAVAKKFLGNSFIYYRLGYNIFSLIFLALLLYVLLFRHEMNFVWQPSDMNYYAGIVLMACGMLVMAAAFKNYDLGEFIGIKQISRQVQQTEVLVVKGLNQWVRHPLYFGIILFVIGLFLLLPTYMNLLSGLVIVTYLYVGTKLEEKKLEAVFGEEYRDYKKRVKMLIPFLF